MTTYCAECVIKMSLAEAMIREFESRIAHGTQVNRGLLRCRAPEQLDRPTGSFVDSSSREESPVNRIRFYLRRTSATLTVTSRGLLQDTNNSKPKSPAGQSTPRCFIRNTYVGQRPNLTIFCFFFLPKFDVAAYYLYFVNKLFSFH